MLALLESTPWPGLPPDAELPIGFWKVRPSVLSAQLESETCKYKVGPKRPEPDEILKPEFDQEKIRTELMG